MYPTHVLFGTPDQGQTLDVGESQTAESALRWQMCHVVPHHNLERTLEVILEHKLRIKTMTLVFSPGSRSESLSQPRNQYMRKSHDLIPKS
jgi:hypothetical protein